MSLQALMDALAKAGAELGPPREDARRKWPFVASLTFQGIPVDIEQKKGDTREGVDKDGTPWKVKMLAHYGEIRRTTGTVGAKGMDGDRLDVYVGPDAASPLVVVVDQRIPETGEFDEQKVMLGFSTVADALACYRGQYTKPGFLGGHTTMTIDDLKARMADPSKAGVDITKALGLAEILASLAAGTSPEERVRARFERMLNRTDPVRAEAQRLLDATWSLAQRAQRYHWNVTGPTFSELHELFGAQYDEANAAVDEIAERMRAMGVRDVSPRPQGAAHPEPGESATAAAEQVRLLLVDHQNAARIANNLALAAEDAHDAATVDLAGRRALAHEKAAWMLDATMGPDAIAKAKRKQPRTPFIGPKGGKWANESHTRHWSKVDNHDPRAKADYYAKLRRTQTANAKGTIYTLTKWGGDHPERVEVAHHPDSGRVHLRFAGRAVAHSSHDPADLLITPDAIIHRTAGVLAKRDNAPEPRLAPLTEPIAKAGPYIGPKGGKWADPAHTIPWHPETHGPHADAKAPAATAARGPLAGRPEYSGATRETTPRHIWKHMVLTATGMTNEQAKPYEDRLSRAYANGESVGMFADELRMRMRGARAAAVEDSDRRAIAAGALQARTPRDPVKKAEAGNLASLLGALAGYEIPEFMAHALARNIAKAAHHKYLRRVLTGKAKPRYRYYYTVTGGKGIGHHDEFAVGAAFRMKDSGKDGHFEVKEDHGDGHVTIRHDESGTEHKVHKDALAGILRSEHAEAIQSAADKAKAAALKTLAEARESGSDKHVERAKAEAAKRGASEDETATPEERKAKEAKPEPEPKVAERPKAEPKSDKSRGPTGEHQRVGSHVAGARRDLAALTREEVTNLTPDEAKKLVTKSKVYTLPTPEDAQADGWSPGAYSLWKSIYNTIGTEPNERHPYTEDAAKEDRLAYMDALDYYGKLFYAARGSLADTVKAIQSDRDDANLSDPRYVSILDRMQSDRAAKEKFGERTYRAGPRHIMTIPASPGKIRRIILGARFMETIGGLETLSLWGSKTTANAIKAARAADRDGWGAASSAPKKPRGEGVIFSRKVTDKPERVGGRPVEAVSAEAMAKEFGLHEVDFGNWVSQEDRGHHVKWAHAAFRDLEDVTGIGSGAVALPGITSKTARNPLAMAFGARGKGGAMAHYEPHARDATTRQLTPTINMTRFSGGGSLAHEWGHFMDNMLGEAHASTPNKGDARFMSENAGSAPESMRTAARNVMSAIRSGAFAQHAAQLGDYWSRPHEMFARAFESYIEDKMAADGRKNSYLVSGTGEKYATGKMVAPSQDEVMALPGMKEATARLKAASDAYYNRDDRKDFINDYAKKKWAENPRRKFATVKDAVWMEAGRAFEKTPEGAKAYAPLAEAQAAHDAIRSTVKAVHAQPYPQGAERVKINAAMDGLMKAIREGRHLEKAMRSILEAAALRKALHIR